MVNAPFTDNTPKDSVIVQKGGFFFLTTRVKRGTQPIVPHADTWLRTDVAVIKDPSGNVVTGTFVTNALDPAGMNDGSGADTYDATHATYKGALADPDNVGLFADSNAFIALKIRVPEGATDTYLDPNLAYTIEWKALVDDGNGGTILIGPTSEKFNVAPAGTFVFGNDYVTVAEVKAGISTKMSNEGITDLIEEATDMWATARLREYGIDSAKLSNLHPGLRGAIVMYARSLIYEHDASAHQIVSEVKEGNERIKFAGNSDSLASSLQKRAERYMKSALIELAKVGKARIAVVTQDYTDEVFRA